MSGTIHNVVTMGEFKAYMDTGMPDETQSGPGFTRRPVTTTSTGDPDVWSLTLQVG